MNTSFQIRRSYFPGVLVGDPPHPPAGPDEFEIAIMEDQPVSIPDPMYFWTSLLSRPQQHFCLEVYQKLFEKDALARNRHPTRWILEIANEVAGTSNRHSSLPSTPRIVALLISEMVKKYGADGLEQHVACRIALCEVKTIPSQLASEVIEMMTPENLQPLLDSLECASYTSSFISFMTLHLDKKGIGDHPLLAFWMSHSIFSDRYHTPAFARAQALYAKDRSLPGYTDCIYVVPYKGRSMVPQVVYLVHEDADPMTEAKVIGGALQGGVSCSEEKFRVHVKDRYITLYRKEKFPEWVLRGIDPLLHATNTGLV